MPLHHPAVHRPGEPSIAKPPRKAIWECGDRSPLLHETTRRRVQTRKAAGPHPPLREAGAKPAERKKINRSFSLPSNVIGLGICLTPLATHWF